MIGKKYSSRIKGIVERTFFSGHDPDFVIVGAQKSGTTSLHSYLHKQKAFYGSTPKEVSFFTREDNFSRGKKWYRSHFAKPWWRDTLTYEATPEYLCRAKAVTRLKQYQPDLKIIILLREPVSRAYSAWNMYREWSDLGVVPWQIANDHLGRDESPIYRTFFKDGCPSFRDCIHQELKLIQDGGEEDEPSILRRGLYKQQIERYVEAFGWQNLLIIGFAELKNNPQEVVTKCHKFLEVESENARITRYDEIQNSRTYKRKINPSDFELLSKFYDEPNKELFDYLGMKPEW